MSELLSIGNQSLHHYQFNKTYVVPKFMWILQLKTEIILNIPLETMLEDPAQNFFAYDVYKRVKGISDAVLE